MKLVRLSNYKLEIEDELLLLKPFKEVYKQDKTKDKSKFMDFLTIVYYTYDPRSDYSYITDEESRIQEVCDSNGLSVPKFTKSELDCIELYKKSTTTASSLLLEDTKVTIDKMREMLKSIDFTILEEKDKVTAIKNVASTVSMIPKLVKELADAEKAVSKELEEQSRARGGNKKNLFEDGIRF
jgi:uncharacterized protein YuzE